MKTRAVLTVLCSFACMGTSFGQNYLGYAPREIKKLVSKFAQAHDFEIQLNEVIHDTFEVTSKSLFRRSVFQDTLSDLHYSFSYEGKEQFRISYFLNSATEQVDSMLVSYLCTPCFETYFKKLMSSTPEKWYPLGPNAWTAKQGGREYAAINSNEPSLYLISTALLEDGLEPGCKIVRLYFSPYQPEAYQKLLDRLADLAPFKP